jgi:hypothetical protein
VTRVPLQASAETRAAFIQEIQGYIDHPALVATNERIGKHKVEIFGTIGAYRQAASSLGVAAHERIDDRLMAGYIKPGSSTQSPSFVFIYDAITKKSVKQRQSAVAHELSR